MTAQGIKLLHNAKTVTLLRTIRPQRNSLGSRPSKQTHRRPFPTIMSISVLIPSKATAIKAPRHDAHESSRQPFDNICSQGPIPQLITVSRLDFNLTSYLRAFFVFSAPQAALLLFSPGDPASFDDVLWVGQR